MDNGHLSQPKTAFISFSPGAYHINQQSTNNMKQAFTYRLEWWLCLVKCVMLHVLLIRCIKKNSPFFDEIFFPFLNLGLVFYPSKLFLPTGGSRLVETLLLPGGWQHIWEVINHFVILRKSQIHLPNRRQYNVVKSMAAYS